MKFDFKKIWTVEALIRYNFNVHGPVCMWVIQYIPLELPLTATSLQRPLKRIPNCQKTSRQRLATDENGMATKFDPYGASMI